MFLGRVAGSAAERDAVSMRVVVGVPQNWMPLMATLLLSRIASSRGCNAVTIELRIESEPEHATFGPGGLVLEPSVFIWPDLYDKRWTATGTTICYAARGVGVL